MEDEDTHKVHLHLSGQGQTVTWSSASKSFGIACRTTVKSINLILSQPNFSHPAGRLRNLNIIFTTESCFIQFTSKSEIFPIEHQIFAASVVGRLGEISPIYVNLTSDVCIFRHSDLDFLSDTLSLIFIQEAAL